MVNQKNGGKYYTKSWEKIMNQENGGTYYITEKMVKIHENM
jgi:hypothetical protein